MMQQSPEKLEMDVKRSLDRLKIISKEHEMSSSVPAFYYSANLLSKYAMCSQPNHEYFHEFKDLIDGFAQNDFSQMKKNHQEVMEDTLEIVNSQQFIDCMRPDIKKIKENNHPVHHSLHAQHQLVPAIHQPSEMELLWKQIQHFYQEHEIDQAYALSVQFKEKWGAGGSKIAKNKQGESKSNSIQPEQQQLIDTISLEYATMTKFYSQFDQDGWIFDKESKGIRLQYKIYEQEKQIAIKISGQFDIEVEHFLAIISEIDLMGDYVPFCYDSKEMKMISRNEKIGTSKIYIPLLTDRQTYFYAAGYDRIKQKNSIFLFSKTINNDILYQQKYGFKVPLQTEYVRLEYKFFIIEYVPIGKSRARIRLASKVDMKLNFLPQFILHKSARIFAFDYFKNILDKSKNFKGSKWEQKVKQNPDIYSFFRKKVEQYLGSG